MQLTMRGKDKNWLIVGLLLALFAVGGVLFAPSSNAAINSQINFQGKLTNPDGTNVADGTYSVVYSIYSVASGGTAVWTETQSSVAVSSGIFQVSLGSVTPLPGSVNFNSSALYLGVKVGADAEMTPRIQFTAAPYAFNSDQVGGISAAGLVQLSPGSQQTGNININGSVTAGSSLLFSSAATATIQSATGRDLSVDSGTSGAVSLGTSNATSVTLGKFGTPVNAAGGLTINSGTNVPSADQLVIDNTSSTGVTAAGINGLNLKYKGGAAAVEAAGMRLDYTPGTTTGGIWSGMRIVQTAGAAAGVTSYGIKLEGAGTGSGTDAAIEVNSGWDIGIDVQSGGLQLAAQTDPATPTAGNLRIYAKDIAGRVLPKWIGPSGVDTPIQANLGFNRVAYTLPNGTASCTATGVSGFGSTIAGGGTCTAPGPTSTNLKSSTRRLTLGTGTTANTSAYERQSTMQVWRGNAAKNGGFFFTTRFGMNTLQTNNLVFVGLADIAANPTGVTDYSTSAASSKIGLSISATTGNWRLVYNAATTPTIVDLGSTIPVNTTDLMELILFSAPNGTSIGYRVQDITTGAQVSGSLSTNIPASTTFLAPFYYVNNNGQALSSILDFGGWYLESDN